MVLLAESVCSHNGNHEGQPPQRPTRMATVCICMWARDAPPRVELFGQVCLLYEEGHTSEVIVEESSVARKRVWTYGRPPRGTPAAKTPPGNRRLPFFLRQRYLTWETPLSANATS